MRKISLLLMLISALLISCADKEQETDEIIKYYNEEWVPINNFKKDELGKFTTEFRKLDSKKDKSEATELIKSEIVPVNEEVVSRLESVDSKNNKIKKMNKLQIEAEQFAIESYHNIIECYEGEMTESELEDVNKKLDSMYDDVLKYHQKVFEKYNLEQSDEKIGNFSKLEKADEK